MSQTKINEQRRVYKTIIDIEEMNRWGNCNLIAQQMEKRLLSQEAPH
jgi:hypothetical protein